MRREVTFRGALAVAVLGLALGSCRATSGAGADQELARGSEPWRLAVDGLVEQLVDRASGAADPRSVRLSLVELDTSDDPALEAAARVVEDELAYALSARVALLAENGPEEAPFGPTDSVVGSLERDIDGLYLQLRWIELSEQIVLAPARGALPVSAESLALTAPSVGAPRAVSAPGPSAPGPTLHRVPGERSVPVEVAPTPAIAAAPGPAAPAPAEGLGPGAARIQALLGAGGSTGPDLD